MSDVPTNEPPGSSRRFWLHLSVFLVLLAIWTWKLLEPLPVPETVVRKLNLDLYVIASKCAHAGVYAVLTVLALTLPTSRGWRWSAS